jgi:hypothetical protein
MEIESTEEPEEDAAFHTSVKRSAVIHPDEEASADTIECEACKVVEFPSDPSPHSDLVDSDMDLKTNSKTASKSITATPESDSSPMLPTPDPTPEPDRRSAEPDKQTADSASEDFATQIQPRHRIVEDVRKLNTVEGPRTRKRLDRRADYFAELERLNELPACLAVFSAGLIHGRDERDRLHRDQLPAPD